MKKKKWRKKTFFSSFFSNSVSVRLKRRFFSFKTKAEKIIPSLVIIMLNYIMSNIFWIIYFFYSYSFLFTNVEHSSWIWCIFLCREEYAEEPQSNRGTASPNRQQTEASCAFRLNFSVIQILIFSVQVFFKIKSDVFVGIIHQYIHMFLNN